MEKRSNAVPRVLVPMLGMIALALIVGGLPAQERQERARADDARAAYRVAPSVMSFRSVGSGSYLGVFIREVTSEDVERLELAEERGALVTDVPDEGPAAEAGIEADDVIVSWNGSRVESAAQLRRVVSETPAGRSVEVGYVRDGRQRTASVEVADRRPALARFAEPTPMAPEARQRLEESMGELRERFRARPGDGHGYVFMRGGRLGVGIQSLTDQLAEYFRAPDGGVLVTSVRDDSPAQAAGLRAGDVIVRVGDEEVEDPGDLMSEISRAEAGDVELRIVRDGREQSVRVTLPERGEGERGFGSGNAFFFTPETFFGHDHGPSGIAWQETLGAFELPDFEFALPNFEFTLPEIPEIDLRFEVPADPPREPVIQT